MPDINESEKQKAKAQAANLAVAANDSAVAIGAFGAVAAFALVATGVGTLAGVGVGAACAVGSFGAWWVGNRYQRLANDPPRDDFNISSISQARVPELEQSSEDGEFNARKLATQQFILADALDCLVTSIERYDGAIAANDMDAAALQADAVQRNANAAIAAQSAITEASRVLAAALTEAEVDWSLVDLEKLQNLYREAVGANPQEMGDRLRQVLDSIEGLAGELAFQELDPAQDPILSLTELPEPPSTPIPAEFVEATNSMAEILGSIVTSTDNS